MHPVFFTLPEWIPLAGGAVITSFGVFMLLSFLTAGIFARAEFRRTGIDPDHAWDLLFMAMIGGVLGAKIYYALLNYPRLVENPVGMLTDRGGMVWYGGFLGATALVLWQVRRLQLPVGKVADGTAPTLAISYAVGRIGCFLVGDDYGRPTDSWVGIPFPEGTPPTTVESLERSFEITVDPALVEKFGEVVPVHPTQLYEIALSTLIFLLLWRLRRGDRRAGWLFMVWLTLAGLERFVVEFVRVKDDRFFGILSLAQMISLGLVAVGIAGVVRLSKDRVAAETGAPPRSGR